MPSSLVGLFGFCPMVTAPCIIGCRRGIVRPVGIEKERCVLTDGMTECGFLNFDDCVFIEFSTFVSSFPDDGDSENE